ncbi:hypothetical protein BaRGS_00038607 [Batillaria attramentaria]|uniref:C1q domain-containing protein n=1 Tax=Batillaria attramentaria TaxID=370345 RepID=A0ABD0J665_9CAEN
MFRRTFLFFTAAINVLHGCEGPQVVKDDNSNEWHVPLLCGRFEDRGTPPLVPYLTNPRGERQTSARFDNGSYVFLLPNPTPTGAYQCSLPDWPSNCPPSPTPLPSPAYLYVEMLEVAMAVLKGRYISDFRDLELSLTARLQEATSKNTKLKARLAEFERSVDEFEGPAREQVKNVRSELGLREDLSSRVDHHLDNLAVQAGNKTGSLTPNLQTEQKHLKNQVDQKHDKLKSDSLQKLRDTKTLLDSMHAAVDRHLQALNQSRLHKYVTIAGQVDVLENRSNEVGVRMKTAERCLADEVTTVVETENQAVRRQMARSAKDLLAMGKLERILTDSKALMDQKYSDESQKILKLHDMRSSIHNTLLCAHFGEDNVMLRSLYDVIKYRNIVRNDGDAYNVTDGTFTAPVSGVYIFLVTLHNTAQSTSGLFVATQSNGYCMLSAGSERWSTYHTCVLALHFQKGVQMQVRSYYGMKHGARKPFFRHTSLYAFLLRPDL